MYLCSIQITDSFGQFDYGAASNMRRYNSTVPPTYDLKSIKVPVTLIYGKNDILTDVKVSFAKEFREQAC